MHATGLEKSKKKKIAMQNSKKCSKKDRAQQMVNEMHQANF
jgi:hypothetical protein